MDVHECANCGSGDMVILQNDTMHYLCSRCASSGLTRSPNTHNMELPSPRDKSPAITAQRTNQNSALCSPNPRQNITQANFTQVGIVPDIQ